MKFKLTPEAQHAVDTGEPIESLGSSSDFWYDLTLAGYFKPEDVLADPKQIKKVKDAILLVQDLEEIYNQVSERYQ